MNDIVSETIDCCSSEFACLMDHEHREGVNIDNNPGELDKNNKEMILSDGYPNLPKGIEKIAICRYDSVSQSWNAKAMAGHSLILTMII